MTSLSGAWLVGNALINGLTTTHAFEIYANGELVFSKLATGRLPSLEEFWMGISKAFENMPLMTRPGHARIN